MIEGDIVLAVPNGVCHDRGMGFLKDKIGAVWRFVRDLCIDSHAAVSFMAPVSSLGFTLVKWAEVPIVGLKDISYAWALLPLLIWFIVGYARRRAMTDRTNKVRKLKEFYASADPLIYAKLPRDISDEDFQKYKSQTQEWLDGCAGWISREMGPLAASRFYDRANVGEMQWSLAVNGNHSSIVMNLRAWKSNLKDMIENPSWDND